MGLKGFHLAWIVVKDVKKAVQFYTEVVGLTSLNFDEEYGWAELAGPDGAILGIAQASGEMNIKPGQNAVVTFSVDNIEKSCAAYVKKGTKMIGEIMEVPGHVKLQMCMDQDGNYFQLCEEIESKLSTVHECCHSCK
jgi:predicted enzyme related to lactoylglutathione lyase